VKLEGVGSMILSGSPVMLQGMIIPLHVQKDTGAASELRLGGVWLEVMQLELEGVGLMTVTSGTVKLQGTTTPFHVHEVTIGAKSG